MTEFVLQKLRFQDLGDMDHLKALNRLKETQDVQIEESETAVTKQQTLKIKELTDTFTSHFWDDMALAIEDEERYPKAKLFEIVSLSDLKSTDDPDFLASLELTT